jgi:transposase
MEIRQLRKQGLTISEIARKLDVDRKTVRSALHLEVRPKYERISSDGKLKAFQPYIDDRLEKYSLTSQRILEYNF